jgi:tripartite ATP-independent transporter DctM subunit
MIWFVVILFAILLAVLFAGTPIGLGMGFIGVTGILIFLNPNFLAKLCSIAYTQSTSISTLMIPLFILMAEFLSNSKIAGDLFEVISRRLKKLPASLAISSIISSAIFAAVCGSAPATAVTMGKISIPSMLKHGYRASFAAGTQAAGGNLGILIPPSINFILYGMITETSIVKLFAAGVMPGVMIAVMMVAYALIHNKVDPKLIVPPPEDRHPVAAGGERKISLFSDIATVVPVVVLIILIFAILYSGIATATESAAIGAVGALVIVLAQKRMTKDVLKKTLHSTTSTTCMIMVLMFGGLAFTMFLTVMGLPKAMSELILTASPDPWVTFVVVVIVFLVLGCFMDPLSIMLIVLPFVFPFMKSLGFDPVWFGVIVTIACGIGMITPPVGMNLFVVKGATGVPMASIIRGVIPYVAIFCAAIAILCALPGIATFLPNRI